MFRHWNGAMIEPLSLGGLQKTCECGTRVTFSGGPGSAGGAVGLNDLEGLFQPQ